VGERLLPNMPVRMSNVAELNYSMPPDFGRHNREIFGRLPGLSDAEIANLMGAESYLSIDRCAFCFALR
jgi:crotonobetainyl-CoA:carnitine CoA-transferase CaiB-like acyl-CoA transferase